MPTARITREKFLQDRQGKTFRDVPDDSKQPFDEVLDFSRDDGRQRPMEEAELHHDRAPLAGVVRELESVPKIDRFLGCAPIRRNTRFRQAVGVLVRMIMESLGWKKTGRKGSLGTRAKGVAGKPAQNTGGLALWFIRAERYELLAGMPFRSVSERFEHVAASPPQKRKKKA